MLDALLGLFGKGLDFFSSQKTAKQQAALAQQQMAMQYDFAKHGIGWKVQDSLASGIHPLVGLGATTSSPSPVSVGSGPETNFSGMGQDLGRALRAMMPDAQREEEDQKEARRLQLEKGSLENDILKQELVSKRVRNVAGVGPQFPISGNTPSSRIPLPVAGPYRSGGGFALSDAKMDVKEEGHPAVKISKIWTPFGTWNQRQDPDLSSGQDIEDQHGEGIGSEPYQLLNNVGNAWYDIKQRLPGWPVLRKSGYQRPRGHRGAYK